MTEHPLITRRRLLGLFGAAATLPVLSACGSSVGGDTGGGGGGEGGGEGGGTVKVGLVVPQSGVYAALGTDMQRGWELWL
jgi:branched-chain amino acid transport system substrate-binding protein